MCLPSIIEEKGRIEVKTMFHTIVFCERCANYLE